MTSRSIRSLARAFLLGASDPAAAQLTEAEEQALLDLHNVERCAVDPPATAMPALGWDSLLASVAQSYADGCTFVHNPNRTGQYAALGGSGSVGENIALGTASFFSPTDLAQLWADEQALWTYGPVTSQNFMDVGHYTQMIWATTMSVGCGAALCPTPPSNARFLVCNYAPAGNFLNQAPYAAGSGTNEACIAVPEPTRPLAALAAAVALAGLRARRGDPSLGLIRG